MPFLSTHALGHHTLMCRYGGDVVSRHNRLRDGLLESCQLACLGPHVDTGIGLGHEGHRTRPGHILLWDLRPVIRQEPGLQVLINFTFLMTIPSQRNMGSAISLVQDGLYSRAYQILTSSGITAQPAETLNCPSPNTQSVIVLLHVKLVYLHQFQLLLTS